MTVVHLPVPRRSHTAVDVRVLGPLQVTIDERPCTPHATKVRALLTTLALHGGEPLSSEVLIDELWDAPPRTARNVLQSYISRLRNLFADTATALELSGAGYRLALPDGALDLDRYRAALAAADTAPDGPTRRDQLDQALGLWQGDPVPDLSLGRRGEAALSSLLDANLQVRERRAVLALEQGDCGAAVTVLRELVERQPLREPTWGHLIDALVGAGDRPGALLAYDQLRRLLADELGVGPSPQLRQRHTKLLADDRQEPPAATRPAQVPRSRPSAPIASTSLIGRDHELRRLAQLVADVRLVTVTGTTGIGKSRLAIELAHDHLDELVGVVEVADCRDLRDVLRALRDGLCPTLRSDTTVDELIRALHGTRGLMVLDGCEAQLEACARVVSAMLRSCPDLRVLSTCQEPLHVLGEYLVPLQPLAVPSEDASVAKHLDAPAVRLFVERARAAGWHAPVDARTVTRIGRIVRELDGLPLALELAAARLSSLSVERLHARLSHPFGVLRDGPRSAPHRHRTLRSAIASNHDLLDADDRELFARMAVFHSPVHAEDVREVAAATGAPLAEVEDAVGRLLRSSLLQRSEDGTVAMLTTVRTFAAELLQGSGDAEAVARRHSLWVQSRVVGAEHGQRGGDRERWWRHLRVLQGDIRAAFDHALDAGEAAVAVQLVDALWWHWYLVGDHRVGLELIRRTLALPGAFDTPTGARALSYAGLFAGLLGDHDRSLEDATRADELLVSSGDLHGAGIARMVASFATLHRDPHQALRLALEALSLHRRAGVPWCVASTSHVAAHLRLAVGDLDGAAQHAIESDRLFTRIGDPHGISSAAQVRSDIASARGDLQAAREHLRRGLEAAGEAHHAFGIATGLLRLAAICIQAGDHATVARLLGAARALEWRTGFAIDAQLPGAANRLERAVRDALGDEAARLAEAGAQEEPLALALVVLATDRSPATTAVRLAFPPSAS